MRCIILLLFLISTFTAAQSNNRIESLIENSDSLSQIMAGINFAFEQKGDKQISNDGQYVTVKYENGTLVHPMITYTVDGKVTQIIFLMPAVQAEKLIEKLIDKHGTSTDSYGETVVRKGNLIYNHREKNSVGMVIIYN